MTKKLKNTEILLGAHVSIAGGLEKAIYRGTELGCTAIQIFTQSNRSWTGKKITQQEIDSFIKAQENSNISVVISHASYLINIGSANKITEDKSTQALEQELTRCQSLQIPYIVLHPGSSLNLSPDKCIEKISNNINKIFEQVPGKTMLLLETAAGQGSSVGHKFEQLAAIKEKIEDQSRVGICIDTCHIFAAGYDINSPEQYKNTWHKINQILGLSNIKAIHLNNSKKELGSLKDRHEHIDRGLIKLEVFKEIINNLNFINIPKIIETPIDSFGGHKEDLEILKKLINKN